jgi:hypothetical protein
VAALRMAINEVATRDFVRSELRALLEELQEDSHHQQVDTRARSTRTD